MEKTLSITSSNKWLNKAIDKKIEQIKSYERDIPAVIILINVQTLSVVYMSKKGREILGISLEELHDMGSDFFQRFINEEDADEYIPYLKDLLHQNNTNKIVSFFQQVRTDGEQSWSWYFCGVKIFLRNCKGLPFLAIITAIPINHLHYATSKVNRLIDENIFLHQNCKMMKSLTKRETEVLKLVASGYSTEEISNKLFLSKETVATHRKNIKRKLHFKTHHQIICFAQAFDLI